MVRIAAMAISLAFGGTVASAQTLDDLKNDGKNPDNVLTYGMGYHQNRHSPLKQIDKTNVRRLVPIWNVSLDNQWGEQAQPLIHNGVMYVTNARATVAIDVATGRQIWRTPVEWVPETPRVVCCGVSNKGAALLNGKVFRTTLDAHVVALDAKTGKEVWRQKAAEWKEGFSMTLAPQIANGVVITGMSGAEFGIRGYIDGWDVETGQHLWRRFTIPARGEKGNDTWPQDNNAWEVGGGSAWITGSYDPELDLTYWGTGNPAPWASQSRNGDNLYTSSVLALRPKTGEIVWHYQFTPNDPYDFDANWELMLADIDVDGQKRKVVMPTSTSRPAGRSRPSSARRCAPTSRSKCGRRRAAARTGRTPPTIPRPGSSMPTRCTAAASTSTFRPSRMSSASATSSSRTGPRRLRPARRSPTSMPSSR
jgi:alcohol dehydrogenase (cytochrome c)